MPVTVLILAASFLLLIVAFQSFVIVPQQEIRIQERLGKFRKLFFAGIHLKIPIIDRIVGRQLTLRIQQLDVSVETKTKDNVFVHVTVSTQFQIISDHVYDAYYRLLNVQGQMQSYVFDVVRSRVPEMDLDVVFANKDSIAKTLQQELGATMEAFGYKIIRSLITDINPDAKVKTAMNEINGQLRLKLAAAEEAEGLKIRRIKAAEADAEAMRLTGIGLAQQRTAIVEGLRGSIESFSSAVEGVTPQEIMDLVLKVQYYDTLKDVTKHSKTNTLLLPATDTMKSSGSGSLDAKIRDAILTANLATRPDFEA